MNRKEYEDNWNHIYRSRPDSEPHSIKCNEAYKKMPKVLVAEWDKELTDFPAEYAKAIDFMMATCGNFLVLPEGFNEAWKKHL